MKREYRATQLWSLLVSSARSQQVFSYVLVEKLTRIPKQAVERFLYPIRSYCKRHKLPPLTALIVNENTGFRVTVSQRLRQRTCSEHKQRSLLTTGSQGTHRHPGTSQDNKQTSPTTQAYGP